MTTDTTSNQSDERSGLPSASTLHRTVDCPGWNNLWREVVRVFFNGVPPKEAPSPAAERGNRIHRARELMNPLELTDESEILAYERGCALEREAVNEWITPFGKDASVKEGDREQRIWLHDDNMDPIFSARLDIHYLYGGKDALYIDWKSGFGYGLGAAKDNWQVKSTAMLLANEYDLDTVSGVLLKMEKWPSGSYDMATFNKREIAAIEQEIRGHLAVAARPDAPRRAGPQCDWCPCKAYCAEGQAYGMLPMVVARTGAELSKDDIQAKVLTLDVPDLVFIWTRRNVSKNLQEAVLDRLKTLPETTLNEFGIRFAPGKDTSYIPGEKVKEACAGLIDAGFTEDQVWQCLEPSVTKLVAEHLKVNPGASKTSVEKWVKSILAKFKNEQRGERWLKEI